jgi:hypothetical protein
MKMVKEFPMAKDKIDHQFSSAGLVKVFMPYCLCRLRCAQKKHVFMMHNREYAALGKPKSIYQGGRGAQIDVICFANDPTTFEGVWPNLGGKHRNTTHLYGDDPVSRSTYFQRLEKLLSHSHGMYRARVNEDDSVTLTAKLDVYGLKSVG